MKKNRNKINIPDALAILKGYGLQPVVFRDYQIRIKHEEHRKFYDWYHTSGVITVINDGKTSKATRIIDAGEVAEFIIKNLRT